MALNVFSVDVEDWYHGIELPYDSWGQYTPRIAQGLMPLLDAMDAAGAKGTFFTLGWVAQHHPELVREIAKRGHELASHGYTHEKVYNLTPATFKQEVTETKKIIEDLVGQDVVAYRAPFFSITPRSLWALDILAETGHRYDCSINPVKTWRYGIANSPDTIYQIQENGIIEYPVSRFTILRKKWAIGGAYFRLLPYFLTKRGLQQTVATKGHFMFYIHPWEYDPSHPVVPMEWKAKLTHYSRLDKTLDYTARMLRDFQFTTLSHFMQQYQTQHAIGTISTTILHH